MTGPTTDEMVWDMYDQSGRVRAGMSIRDVGSTALANVREDNPVYYLSAGGDAYEDQGPFRLTVVRDEG